MNIKMPVSWLREYLKTDIATKTLANFLSLSGPSVEQIEKHGDDYVLEIEVTTNRIDTASVIGIVREAYAILSSQGNKPTLIAPKGLDLRLQPDTAQKLNLNVVIKNPNLCPRFCAIVIDNVKIKPSPALIKRRLETSGIRSINNIVDISNYIMLELGQPMHTFDYDKIKGAKMILRKSINGEKITTIDKVTRKLPQGSIVIEDESRLIDLCGIMGGVNSRVTSRTKRVVVFVQAYNPLLIRKTTQALGFRTEAATRFEKGIDLEGILPALSRAVYLAKQTAQAKIASELIDIYPQKQAGKTVKLNLTKLRQYLGIEMEKHKAAQILVNLGFEVKLSNQHLIAQAPSWRAGDIQEDVDLIEEISRIFGYHNLPSKLPSGQITQEQESNLKDVIELKKALKFTGLTEIISYSIISKNLLSVNKLNEKDAVELANPLTDLWQFMRPTLIPSLLEVIAKNQNLKKDLKIFEIAKTYISQKNDLPQQDLMLSIALNNSNFYDIKGLVENVLEILKKDVKWQKSQPTTLFSPKQSAQIKAGDVIIGTVGILNSKIADYFDIEDQIAVCEINLTSLYQVPPVSSAFQPIPKYPPVIEDISAVFAIYTPVAKIVQTAKGAGQPLIKNVEIVDIFESEKMGENKKSVTLRLTFQMAAATPTQEEVTVVREKIISSLEKTFKAQIRK